MLLSVIDYLSDRPTACVVLQVQQAAVTVKQNIFNESIIGDMRKYRSV